MSNRTRALLLVGVVTVGLCVLILRLAGKFSLGPGDSVPTRQDPADRQEELVRSLSQDERFATDEATRTTRSPVRLYLHVQDPNGGAVRDAVVSSHGESLDTEETAPGDYEVAIEDQHIPFALDVEKKGYITSQLQVLRITGHNLVVLRPDSSPIQGRVVLEDGVPAPDGTWVLASQAFGPTIEIGALLDSMQLSGQQGQAPASWSLTTTQQDGAFSIAVSSVDQPYRITAGRPGYLQVVEGRPATHAGDSDVVIKLVKAFGAMVHFVDATGAQLHIATGNAFDSRAAQCRVSMRYTLDGAIEGTALETDDPIKLLFAGLDPTVFELGRDKAMILAAGHGYEEQIGPCTLQAYLPGYTWKELRFGLTALEHGLDVIDVPLQSDCIGWGALRLRFTDLSREVRAVLTSKERRCALDLQRGDQTGFVDSILFDLPESHTEVLLKDVPAGTHSASVIIGYAGCRYPRNGQEYVQLDIPKDGTQSVEISLGDLSAIDLGLTVPSGEYSGPVRGMIALGVSFVRNGKTIRNGGGSFRFDNPPYVLGPLWEGTATVLVTVPPPAETGPDHGWWIVSTVGGAVQRLEIPVQQ